MPKNILVLIWFLGLKIRRSFILTKNGRGSVGGANGEIEFQNGFTGVVFFRDRNSVDDRSCISTIGNMKAVADSSQGCGEMFAVERVPFANHGQWINHPEMSS